MSQLIVCDVDGTLTCTDEIDTHCYVQAITEHLECDIDDDWTHYEHVTDSGIAAELLRRHNRHPHELSIIRRQFIFLLCQSLTINPDSCGPIPGANRFLQRLRNAAGVVVGLATGGWAESAQAKLRHARIDVDRLAFASADDAEARTEIMLLCAQRAAAQERIHRFDSITYIGDGIWDAQAAATLGWRFIGIGCGSRAQQLRSAGVQYVFDDFSNREFLLHF